MRRIFISGAVWPPGEGLRAEGALCQVLSVSGSSCPNECVPALVPSRRRSLVWKLDDASEITNTILVALAKRPIILW